MQNLSFHSIAIGECQLPNQNPFFIFWNNSLYRGAWLLVWKIPSSFGWWGVCGLDKGVGGKAKFSTSASKGWNTLALEIPLPFLSIRWKWEQWASLEVNFWEWERWITLCVGPHLWKITSLLHAIETGNRFIFCKIILSYQLNFYSIEYHIIKINIIFDHLNRANFSCFCGLKYVSKYQMHSIRKSLKYSVCYRLFKLLFCLVPHLGSPFSGWRWGNDWKTLHDICFPSFQQTMSCSPFDSHDTAIGYPSVCKIDHCWFENQVIVQRIWLVIFAILWTDKIYTTGVLFSLGIRHRMNLYKQEWKQADVSLMKLSL